MKKSLLLPLVACLLLCVFFAVPFSAGALVFNSNEYYDIMYNGNEPMTCGDYTYVLQEDGTAMITHYRNVSKEHSIQLGGNRFSTDANGNRALLQLPEELDGHPVTGVASGSFDEAELHLFEADVFIPNTMMNIEPYAFGDSSVHRYLISSDHPKYLVIGDMLYEKETMRLVDWTGAASFDDNCDTLTIPEGTRIIGGAAFAYVQAKEIILPESLESIEDEAFFMADNLEKIHIPDSVKHIGESAFFECRRLSEVALPQNLSALGNNAFHTCSSLKQVVIPGSLEKIGAGAFSYCVALQQVQMQSGVKVIDNGAFFECWALEKMELPSTVNHVGAHAFSNCKGLKEIHLPEGLITMGYEALAFCDALTELTIPNSLIEVDAGKENTSGNAKIYPFLTTCSNLERIIVSPDHPVFAVVDGALIRKTDKAMIVYPDAAKTEQITVPEWVQTIGEYAFSDNVNLKEVVVSEGVTTIEKGAFSGCKNLRDLTLPLSLTTPLVTEQLSNGTYQEKSDVINDCPQLRNIYITTGLSEASYQENEKAIMALLADACTIVTIEAEKRRCFLVPPVLTEEDYELLIGQMEGKKRKQTQSNYKKVSISVLEKMSDEERDEYLNKYPALTNQNLYILKDVKTPIKENLEEYFAAIGYTEVDYAEDLKWVNPQRIKHMVTGEVKKKCEYVVGNGMMLQPFVCIENEKPVSVVLEETNASVLLDPYGTPSLRTYFRTAE